MSGLQHYSLQSSTCALAATLYKPIMSCIFNVLIDQPEKSHTYLIVLVSITLKRGSRPGKRPRPSQVQQSQGTGMAGKAASAALVVGAEPKPRVAAASGRWFSGIRPLVTGAFRRQLQLVVGGSTCGISSVNITSPLAHRVNFDYTSSLFPLLNLLNLPILCESVLIEGYPDRLTQTGHLASRLYRPKRHLTPSPLFLNTANMTTRYRVECE